jgi:hypothetical protein
MTVIINANSSGLVETVDTSGNLQFQTNGLAALHINTSQNITANSTGAITVNVGNTAQRPTGANGMIRYSNTSNTMEVYVNGAWANVNTSAGTPAAYNIAVTVVAGGGGGGGFLGGGGGAGGIASFAAFTLQPGTAYTANIGAGGAGATNSQNTAASNGSNSTFGSGSLSRITAIGGGGGGTLNQRPGWKGSLGGSGGGDQGQNNEGLYGSYGPGIPGQGFDGGFSISTAVFCGGGGAGGIGANGASTASGGVGIINQIAGSTAGQLISGNYWLAGGGAAGSATTSTGGNGGGGNTGVSGTVNTGGGGGGQYNGTGGSGGSGVIVISIPIANYPGNGNVSGTYTYANTGTAIVLGFTANTVYTA